MFFARKKSPSGQTLQLLASYRNAEGKPRHRVVVSLGDVDVPAALWGVVSDAVELRLTGQQSLIGLEPAAAQWVDWIVQRIECGGQHRRLRCGSDLVDGVLLDRVQHTRHRSLGPELLGLHAWDQLGMPDLLEALGFNRSQRDAAAASVINRLSDPVSENGLANWVRTSSLVDLLGQPLARARRDRFYRVSDRLLAHQRRIEAHLREAQARHFGLQRTLVLYDLTNSHFEGACRKNPKARRGANKQKRFDCPQLTVGMVFDEYGFGLAHKTFAGNRSESTTLLEMVQQLDKLTGKDATLAGGRPPTVIVDAGIATQENLEQLRRRGYAYLVNETRKRREIYATEFAEDELFEAIPDRNAKTSVKVRRIEIPAPEDAQGEASPTEYVVLCKSVERRQKELAIQSRAEERLLAAVRALAQRLEKGNLKNPRKIDQAIGRLRQKHSRASGYYDIWAERIPNGATQTKLPKSVLHWQRHDDARAAADQLLGCYVLRTTRDDLAPERVWQVYTTLCKAEDGFRALKSNLGLRPNRHQTEDRADAHVFITVLAYHLLCFILETLSRADDRRSWPTLRRILQTHHYATVILPTRDGKTYTLRKPGEPEESHKQIYQKFNISVRSLPQNLIIDG